LKGRRMVIAVNKLLVALNDKGRRIGEAHPRAKLLDREIDLVFELHDAGLSYAQIAAKMDMSKSGVQKIINGSRRGQAIARTVDRRRGKG
jgi:DNA-binding NarL/FixJ family response regulator